MDRITYLENKVQELTSLLEAAKELNSEIEIEEVLSNVLRQMVRFVKAEAGTLWILDEDTYSCDFIYARYCHIWMAVRWTFLLGVGNYLRRSYHT
jgi:nitrate/nitrite-specific signal transduction histidine kinase